MAAAIAETAPAAAAAPAKRGKKKLLVILVAVLVVVLGAGGGAVVYLKKKAAAQAAAEVEDGGEVVSATARPDQHNPPVWLPLDPFIVNLADREADRYAQVGITLELDSAGSAEMIRGYMPAVRNAILLILASKTSKDLADRAGKEQLAEEIAREAVRPMGIDIAAPQPVVEAASAVVAVAAEASAASEAKPGRKRMAAVQKNPIQHVHFSSFIVQ